jgi:hypothetical protein
MTQRPTPWWARTAPWIAAAALAYVLWEKWQGR